jgi:hypothetical protein
MDVKWSELVKALLEKTVLFPSGALCGLTVFVLRSNGYLTNVKDEATWIAIAGIFCGWVSVLLGAQKIFPPVASFSSAKANDWMS